MESPILKLKDRDFGPQAKFYVMVSKSYDSESNVQASHALKILRI